MAVLLRRRHRSVLPAGRRQRSFAGRASGLAMARILDPTHAAMRTCSEHSGSDGRSRAGETKALLSLRPVLDHGLQRIPPEARVVPTHRRLAEPDRQALGRRDLPIRRPGPDGTSALAEQATLWRARG